MYLHLQLFSLFPAELWAAEMAVSGCSLIDWLLEVQISDNDSRSEVKVLLDDPQNLAVWAHTGAVTAHKDGQGLRHSDSIGHLNKHPAAK